MQTNPPLQDLAVIPTFNRLLKINLSTCQVARSRVVELILPRRCIAQIILICFA